MGTEETVRMLLDRYGRSYASQAGIRVTDTPSPLYRLLVLAHLLSARISADIAVAAARELSAAGYRTPRAMLDATWQQRVDALGRGHYRRYDERTATQLGDGARLLRDRWRGDLRRLRDEADGTAPRIHRLLTEFPGIGPTGADIFLREVQGAWPSVAPYFDRRVVATARDLRLPGDPDRLARLVPRDELPAFAAALVRAHGHVRELRAA